MKIAHMAIPVVKAKMYLAIAFMELFGFKKTPYEVKGDWGFAFFVKNIEGQDTIIVFVTVLKELGLYLVNVP